jgi:hypothetical protein
MVRILSPNLSRAPRTAVVVPVASTIDASGPWRGSNKN